MIYPLLRPEQSVFNSAAAIRNTLTLDFDGDVKEEGKPLSVKRPHTHACTHAGKITETQVLRALTLKGIYQKHFILCLFYFLFSFFFLPDGNLLHLSRHPTAHPI